jgi:crotonobetainyl-CoA:carnitine CoA-transferase CaiB-like acyl-CoA transferase
LSLRAGPPALGADTSALLHELGYDEEAMSALRDAGVIGSPPDANLG